MSYLDTISSSVRGMQYGTVVCFIKVTDGKVSTVDAQKLFTHKTREGNTEALTAITTLLKGIAAANETGSLTFTIDFKKGISSKMQVQDLKRVDFINVPKG